MVQTLHRALLDADGDLGLDFLDGHRVTFDFKDHLIQVSEPRARFSANRVRASPASKSPFAPAPVHHAGEEFTTVSGERAVYVSKLRSYGKYHPAH
jgi:hypothetical protein